MTTDRFIAAFYMIDAQRMQALNQLYKEIYPNNNKREKKSNSVSDRINRKALEVAKPFLTSALILERPACDLNQFTDIKVYVVIDETSQNHVDPCLLLN